jgi:hypothetical protein
VNRSKTYQTKNNRTSLYSNPWMKLRLEELAKEPVKVESLKSEADEVVNAIYDKKNDDLPETDIDQVSVDIIDQHSVADLALDFGKLRELTPEELAIKTEFDEYVKLIKKYNYPDYTAKEQLKFERKIKRFERKMKNGLTWYSEKLKIGTWGSEDYFRLRDKFFSDYTRIINEEIERIQLEVNSKVSELTSSLSESMRLAKEAIELADSNQKGAENLMIDSDAKMQEAIQKRAKASETLKEYGTDENTVPILAEFDKIIARYKTLNKLFLDASSGIGEDLVQFKKILPELEKNEHLLTIFNAKLKAAKKLSEFQDLKNNEIPKLKVEIDTLYNKALNLNPTTGPVDEIAYKKEKDQMDQTILEQESKVEQIKADEIERRLANSSMLDLSPEEFFIVYEQRAQKYLDQYYNRNDPTWKAYKKNHSDFFLTGKVLADAAKYVYEHATTKDLKLIAPVELAIGQAKVEGGVNPPSEDAPALVNPMNTGIHDGGKSNKKALSIDKTREKTGWKEAREEGLRYYYKVMYELWMPDYNTVEEMVEYDHFDKNGNTNYTGRYATAVYYEAMVKAEAGIMRMTEDGKLLTKTVGGGKETTEDKKAVFDYIKAFDKFHGKLKNINYSALLKLENGIPTSSSLNSVIKAIQENEIFPAPSTFSENKKRVYDRMGTLDKSGSLQGRTKGVDGEASKFGPTIGFLYYHYLLAGGSVYNSDIKTTDTPDQDKTATTGTPTEKKEGNDVKTVLEEDLGIDKNAEKHYTVISGDARIRNEKGQELNTEGGIFKAGDKYKVIPKSTKVIVTEEKGERVKVKSTDGKTDYGWTNKSNLTRVASASDIKAWKDKKVTATTIADKNKEYADLILEAEELGITQFSELKVRQTFVKIKNLEKIGSGKHRGESENWYSDPKTTEILILSTIISILQTEVDIWLAGDQKGKISNIKIGSFMIWSSYVNEDGINVSNELRDSNHGGKGRAIDINIDDKTNFTSDAAVEMVIRILSNLPEIDGTYEVGLPFQGQFFPKDQKGVTLKKYSTKPLSGPKKVLDYIKSEKLKTAIKDLQKKGYQFQIFPDNDGHLHLGVE